MLRTLMGTLLIASQILTGFGSHSALCLRSDGSICCVHDLNDACSGCNHEHEKPSCPAEHESHFHTVCAISSTYEDDDGETSEDLAAVEFPLNSCAPCGCRRLPLSAATTLASQKPSHGTASDRKQSRPSILQVRSCHGTHVSHIVAELARLCLPGCLTVGLTIFSSTVIRC